MTRDEQLEKRAIAALAAKPAQTCVELAAALSLDTWRARGVLRKLRTEGRVSSTGATRGTRWSINQRRDA